MLWSIDLNTTAVCSIHALQDPATSLLSVAARCSPLLFGFWTFGSAGGFRRMRTASAASA